MSEEKHFDATPSRIAKAKREGNLPRAGEFGANVSFVAAAGGVLVVAPAFGELVGAAVRRAAGGVVPMAQCAVLLGLSLIPMACAAIAGTAAALVQNGGFAFVAVTVKLERMQPLEALKRMLSRETVTHVVRAVVAFAVSVAAIVPVMRDLLSATASGGGALAIASAAWSGSERVVFAAGAIGLGFAAVEFGVARTNWLKKLRMSFEEFRREVKEQDGDPLARQRRRSLHGKLSRGSLRAVKDAAFLLVNPTHVAIALAYRPPKVPVPKVLVRAADEMAARVRELAIERHIPIVENIALARALYADARVGEFIPHAHYVAVAEIVAALSRSGALS